MVSSIYHAWKSDELNVIGFMLPLKYPQGIPNNLLKFRLTCFSSCWPMRVCSSNSFLGKTALSTNSRIYLFHWHHSGCFFSLLSALCWSYSEEKCVKIVVLSQCHFRFSILYFITVTLANVSYATKNWQTYLMQRKVWIKVLTKFDM